MGQHPQLVRNPYGFTPGYTPITREGDEVGFDFGILRLRAGEVWSGGAGGGSTQSHVIPGEREGALLLMDGAAAFELGARGEGPHLECGPSAPDKHGTRVERSRSSLFDQDATVLHFCAGASVGLQAISDCELAVVRMVNPRRFETRLFDRDTMAEPSEHRGQGLLDDTSHRIVRTVFDLRNRPESGLVLGEVVTFPGRWSSYPPHHHPQPEIYHYRFTEPQGFGHGELGQTVLRVRQFDTVKILDGQDHAQVAAPGYGMYYLWAIRHLPDNPYSVPEFTEEHRWLNDPAARFWRPGLS